jgi:hypothetical protein
VFGGRARKRVKSNRSWISSVTTIERVLSDGTERTSSPQPSQSHSRRLSRAAAHGSTRVPIGRKAGGHGEAGMESEEGTAFESLPRRKPSEAVGSRVDRSRVDDCNTEATDESLLWPFPSPLRSGVSTFPRHSDQTAPRPAPQISEERRQTVETARQSWIRKLIDLSRRNNLLYFRQG